MMLKRKGLSDRIQATTQRFSCCVPWLAICVVIFLTALVRLPLLDVPLQRDEGGYAYTAQLLLSGHPLYGEVYAMRLPGIFLAYALILAVFGPTGAGIHMGLLLVNAATIILVFMLGKRLFGNLAGVTAGTSYAVLTLSTSVLGLWAETEHLVVLPAIGGILVGLAAADRRRGSLLFCSGVMLGLAFLVKQHGAVYGIFMAGYLIFPAFGNHSVSKRALLQQMGTFCAGFALPFLLTCLAAAYFDVFDKFWFWTVKYAVRYVSMLSVYDGFILFKHTTSRIITANFPLWILGGVLGMRAVFWDKAIREHRRFMLGFLIMSFFGIFPGLIFREHYFILLFPAVALLIGLGVRSTINLLSIINSGPTRASLLTLFLVGVLFAVFYGPLIRERDILFHMTPYEVSRATYGTNPFPESVEIAKYIREHSKPEDRIAVLGSEPQIYFYAQRKAATSYMYVYPLMEPHGFAFTMQKEMVEQIESAKPRFMVLIQTPMSWVVRASSEKLILNWVSGFVGKYYRLIGDAEILSDGSSVYRWGNQVARNGPKPNASILVYERK